MIPDTWYMIYDTLCQVLVHDMMHRWEKAHLKVGSLHPNQRQVPPDVHGRVLQSLKPKQNRRGYRGREGGREGGRRDGGREGGGGRQRARHGEKDARGDGRSLQAPFVHASPCPPATPVILPPPPDSASTMVSDMLLTQPASHRATDRPTDGRTDGPTAARYHRHQLLTLRGRS